MPIYDVIVVGAGPAGSTAARECAARGLTTLLLERAEFPRDKPCGGGVTVRAARLLPFSLDPVTERVITGMRITVRGKHPLERTAPGPLTYLTQRRRLDAYLAQQAVAAGALLRERQEVRSIEFTGPQVIARTANASYQGRTLVVADGVNGRTARLAGLPLDRWLTVAIEGNVTPSHAFPAEWRHTLGFDAGDPLGGYGWIFPKGDHVNIGLAALPRLGPELRARLHRLTASYGFDPSGLWNVRGYHLPMRRSLSPVAARNLLLVGDAAGLLDPFSLEGMYAAIWSGQRAATHLAAYLKNDVTDLSGYQREVDTELQPDLDAARQIYELSWLLGWRTWVRTAHMVPRSSHLLWGLLRGEQTYVDIKRRLGPASLGLDLASALVRRTPPLRRRAYGDDVPPSTILHRQRG
jgi:geranylgeranyl reductase family protein